MEAKLITKEQAQSLAALLNLIRPRWPIASMMTLFSKHHDIKAPFADVASAALNAARDHIAETPGIIFTDPRFWPEAAKAKLPPAPKCPDHEWEDAHHCRACLADVAAGDRDPADVGKGNRRPHRPQPPPPDWKTWKESP